MIAAAAVSSGRGSGIGSAGAHPGRGKGADRGRGADGGRGGRGGGRGTAGRGAGTGSGGAALVPKYVLPNGEWCSSGTCHINHDKLAPGETCHRDSSKAIKVKSHVWTNEAHMQRLRDARLANHKHFKLPGEPKPISLLEAQVNQDATPGSMSFMFDVGSPEYGDGFDVEADPIIAQSIEDAYEYCT